MAVRPATGQRVLMALAAAWFWMPCALDAQGREQKPAEPGAQTPTPVCGDEPRDSYPAPRNCTRPAARRAPPAIVPLWELTPQVGMYVGLGALTTATDPAANRTRRQIPAALVGARLGWRAGATTGLETAFAYSPSPVATAERDGTTTDPNGGVLLASVRGTYRPGGPPRRDAWSGHVGAGFGLLYRYGASWTDAAGTLDAALVLAVGARVAAGPGPTAFRLDLETYHSRPRFRGPGGALTRPRLHTDLCWSVGLTLPLTP